MLNQWFRFRTTLSTSPVGRGIGIALLSAAALGLVFLLAPLLPIGDDWRDVFHGLPFFDPYAFNGIRPPQARISYPPWIMLFIPHAQLELRLGNALNFLLNLIVPLAVAARLTQAAATKGARRKRLYAACFLTFTSPFYLQLIATNNVDWIPLLAFLFPQVWSGIFLACKPQAVGGAFLIFIRRTRGLALIPVGVLVLLSFLVWPGWIMKIQAPPMDTVINIAPFPLLIPFGVYLIWRAWKENDEVLAASATPFLVPYMTPYAASSNMVLLAARYQKIAFIVWIVMWVHVGIGVRQALF